jgi:hypothetical protein
MLSRRRFLAATAATAALPRVALSAPALNVSAFGARGDGAADDGPAFTRAIEAASRSGAPLTIDPGRYLIATPIGASSLDDPIPAIRGGRIELAGAGAGATTLLAPPLRSSSPGVAPISRSILRAIGVERLHLRGVTLDGGVTSAVSRDVKGFSPRDAAALLEVEGCSDVLIEDVTTTHNRHARFQGDRTGRIIGRSGPVLVLGCSNVRILRCGSVFPAFAEGWWVFDCRNVTIDGFRHVGPQRFNPAATTTPLNVFGPRTESVTITNCDIRNALGSSLNLGGKGGFRVVNNVFAGVIAENEGAFGREAARPHDGAFGKGIDLGSEHQEDYFPDHPPMRDVTISGNRFDTLFSYSVSLAKTPDRPLDGLAFRDNRITHGFRGLMLRGVRNAAVERNRFERILRYEGADRRAFGVTMSLDECVGVTVGDNVFDGSKRTRLGGGMGEGSPDVGVLITRSSDVKMRANRFVGFDKYQLLASVAEGDDLRYGGFEVIGNAFEAGEDAALRPVAIRLGRSERRRIGKLEMRDNRIDPRLQQAVSVFAE